ncbi:UNVERIFIED_CONTAM: hypothetical protein K2H54_021721 [Gekko kuhli]
MGTLSTPAGCSTEALEASALPIHPVVPSQKDMEVNNVAADHGTQAAEPRNEKGPFALILLLMSHALTPLR